MKYLKLAEAKADGGLKSRTLFPVEMCYLKAGARDNLLVLAGKGYQYELEVLFEEFIPVFEEFLNNPGQLVMDLTPHTDEEE